MEYTPNAGLKKPGYDDTVDINDINDNFDTVDEHLGEEIRSETGVHGLRYNKDAQVLEVHDGETDEWTAVGGSEDGGESAYQAAVDAGYTGTEVEFYAALAALQDGPFVPQGGGVVDGELMVGSGGVASSTYRGDLVLKGKTSKAMDTEYSLGFSYVVVPTTGSILAFDHKQKNPSTGIESAAGKIILRGIDTPTSNFDAANKKYVDDKFNQASAGGKSPYQYAVEGGYTGTEEEFKALMADIATKEYVDDVKNLLASHLEKIATLTWSEYYSGNHSVNIKLTPYGRAGSGQYTFTYDGNIGENGNVQEFILSPPPGYAFTNLMYTFVPRIVFGDGQEAIGNLAADGRISFAIPGNRARSDFSFKNSGGMSSYGAILCLEVE